MVFVPGQSGALAGEAAGDDGIAALNRKTFDTRDGGLLEFRMQRKVAGVVPTDDSTSLEFAAV
jgi:hypothetical protein